MNTKKNIVRIGQGRWIPWPGRIGLTLLLFGLLAATLQYSQTLGNFATVAAVTLSALTPAIWTARRILEINADTKYVHRYIWTMGKRFGRKSWNYQKLEGIDLVEGNGRWTANLITDSTPLYLFSASTRESLDEILAPIKNKLEL